MRKAHWHDAVVKELIERAIAAGQDTYNEDDLTRMIETLSKVGGDNAAHYAKLAGYKQKSKRKFLNQVKKEWPFAIDRPKPVRAGQRVPPPPPSQCVKAVPPKPKRITKVCQLCVEIAYEGEDEDLMSTLNAHLAAFTRHGANIDSIKQVGTSRYKLLVSYMIHPADLANALTNFDGIDEFGITTAEDYHAAGIRTR
jgi:hypothetical protein